MAFQPLPPLKANCLKQAGPAQNLVETPEFTLKFSQKQPRLQRDSGL
jgi:hypothetical protein